MSNEHFKGTLTSSKIQINTEIKNFGENGRKFLDWKIQRNQPTQYPVIGLILKIIENYL